MRPSLAQLKAPLAMMENSIINTKVNTIQIVSDQVLQNPFVTPVMVMHAPELMNKQNDCTYKEQPEQVDFQVTHFN